MSLNEEYHKATGLHAFYKRKTYNNKTELAYTRKYVWWLEIQIQELRKSSSFPKS